MKSGIYLIFNGKNGKMYIGQSMDVPRRLKDHERKLKANCHENEYMQRSFNRCGAACFIFAPFIYCDADKMDDLEKEYIEKFQTTDRAQGYNIQSGGHAGHTWSEDARARRSGCGNPMYGRKLSKERVEQIRLQNRGSSNKLTEADVSAIKQAMYDDTKTEKELSEQYRVNYSTISKIRMCNNWVWVRPELNKKLKNISKQQQIKNEQKREEKKKMLEKREKSRLKKIDDVRADYLAGYSREEIIQRNNISNTSYTRYISDLFNEQKQATIAQVQQLRSEGMMVKDIAEKLGIHRTTVTEYCKKPMATPRAHISECVRND